MNTWKTWIQINGEDITHYVQKDIEISDELYSQIKSAVEEGNKLSQCDFADELLNLSEASIDWGEYFEEDEMPLRDEFDDESEYEEALKEYMEEVRESYVVEAIDIDDPGDWQRLKDALVGQSSIDWAADSDYGHVFTFDDQDERDVMYSVEVFFDATGTIKDIGPVNAEGLVYESVRHSEYAECYPDYAFVQSAIESLLN